MSDAVDGAADELYGLPLAEFVPRRDALVRELRAADQKDDAEMVKRMPKPTAPAWVVNQLARERPDDVRELMDAGHELRRVQEWLIRREADPADLRSAVEAERAAVARLVHAGAQLLTAAGRPPRGDILERVGETLHAATADPALRAEVERGRVVRDQAAVGLGPATGPGFAPAGATRRSTRSRAPSDRGGLDAPPPTAAEPADAAAEVAPAKPRRSARKAEESAAARRKAAAAAREELRAAEAEAKAADRMQASADRAVERAARALAAAEESWERARDQLQAAREELAAAEQAAGAAREAAEAAAAEVAEKQRHAAADDDG